MVARRRPARGTAGNTGTDRVVIKLDTTPPLVTATVGGPMNAAVFEKVIDTTWRKAASAVDEFLGGDGVGGVVGDGVGVLLRGGPRWRLLRTTAGAPRRGTQDCDALLVQGVGHDGAGEWLTAGRRQRARGGSCPAGGVLGLGGAPSAEVGGVGVGGHLHGASMLS